MTLKNTLLIALSFWGFQTFGQSEDCFGAAASPITPDGTCHYTTTWLANDDVTGEIGCATAGGQNQHSDQWFSFVATDTQFDLTVTNVAGFLGVPNNTIEVVLMSGSCASLTVEFSSCGAMPLNDQYNGLTIGNTYFVVVSTTNGNANEGDFNVCIDNLTAPVPPANDDCAGATAVPTNGTCTAGTIIAANDSWVGEIGCATTGASEEHLDVWYSFVATGGVADITTTDFTIGGDLEMALVESTGTPCVDSWTVLDSYCGASPLTGTFTGLTPGNTYYYTVSSPNNQTGNFETCVTNYNIANDDCAGAINVPVGTNGICATVTGTNAGATSSAGVPAPTCGNYAGGDVWYSITVPASGDVTFGTDFAATNSLTDIDMEIYSGGCGSLTSIACDDLSGTGSMPDIQGTGLTPGSTVYVRVWDNGNASSGNFNLCFSEPATTLTNQDCQTALALCSDATFGGASNGSGSVNDLYGSNEDCLSGENQTSWLYLEVTTAGDFKFTITPDNGTDDYDFAVWHYPGGTGQACPPPDNSVTRCSYGAGAGFGGSYDTGLDDGTVIPGGPGDNSEGAGGDNWVNSIPVVAGDAIMVVVDNFSSTTSPYTLDFTGNAGLDCTILPAEFMTFYAKDVGEDNLLEWTTLSENNNSFFTIQHSFDGKSWTDIGTVPGAGNSTDKKHYELTHYKVRNTVNYYRLFQTDFDGTTNEYKIISIDNMKTSQEVVITTNLLGQEVDENYSGIVIDVFSDGNSVKRLQK